MSKTLAELADLVAGIWNQISGGQLHALTIANYRPELAIPEDLPREIQNALDHSDSMRGVQIDSRVWWVIIPEGEVIRLVAWSPEDGKWDEVLQSWSILLSNVASEEKVSAGLATELLKAWDRLSFLYELTQHAGYSAGLTEMVESIVFSLANVVDAKDVFLAIHGPREDVTASASGKQLLIRKSFFETIAGKSNPLRFTDLKELPDQESLPYQDVHEIIISPLHTTQGPLGFLGFIDPTEGGFDASDTQLLASVGEHVCALIEAAQAQRFREEQRRLEREVLVAAEIQSSLLPTRLPRIPGCELEAFLKPARKVGGDFYDIALGKSGDPFILIADVAGKGIPAAILTAVVHATFHSEAPYHLDPSELLGAINQAIYLDLDKAQSFVTAVAVRIKTEPLRFAFASAGHVEPLLWCAEGQTTHFLSATGLPLGVENQLTCKTDEHALHPGDLLLLYSDGVSESQNQQGKVFGTQCLSDIIDTSRSASAENLIHLVVDSVAAYSRGFPLQDDLALVLLRSKPRRTLGMTVKPFVTRGEISSLRSVLDWTRANIYDQMSETYRGSHLDNFILALSEVMKNQVEHALEGRGGLIFGNLEVAGEGWSMDLFDRGHPMEKEKHGFRAIDPEDPPLRGYGFRIIHALLDNCTYQRLEDGRNHWHLFKRIRG